MLFVPMVLFPWRKLMNISDKFRFRAYRVNLVAADDISLPPYSGSAIRGLFGHALRLVSCPPQCKDPAKCIIGNACPYFFIFESQRHDTPAGLKNYPHPIVLEPPSQTRIKKGESFSFNFILFGKSIMFLPHIVYAICCMGELGLGKGRGKFKLEKIESIPSGKLVYNPESGELLSNGEDIKPTKKELGNRLTVEFVTPLRLKNKGQYDYQPSFQSLIRSILRRVTLLAKGYCDYNLSFDFKNILKSAENVEITKSDIRKVMINRYSGRQKRKVPLYGALGKITYSGENLKMFSELLSIAEWIHVGGATIFGFGKIKLHTK